MILFWIICAIMLLVALMFVLPPALRAGVSNAAEESARREANIEIYRDQLKELDADLRNGIVSEEQYAQDRDDIERRLLEDTGTAGGSPAFRGQIAGAKKAGGPPALPASVRKHAYMVGIGLALVAVIFYLRVGSPDSITNAAATRSPNTGTGNTAVTAVPGAPAERTQAQIEANVAALAKRLQSNPSDAPGWTMLARSYSSLEKYGEAAGAYEKATELTPKDANLWAEFAFASAMSNGRSLQGKPMEMIDRALKLEPDNAKALQLAGSAAYEAKQYQKAVDYWQRVLKQVPPGTEVAETIEARINEAKSRASSGSSPQKP